MIDIIKQSILDIFLFIKQTVKYNYFYSYPCRSADAVVYQ
ncbi:hypothetical protein CSC17_4102 [Klebsiella oxytoca]|nr:hypothetical protein CSC17_4102 [Klebsiella oxytoca]